jgi:hypothetical protein
MKNLFAMRASISEVVGGELPAEQDQVMDATLNGEGLLVIRMFDKVTDVMRSRISLKVRGSKAVEAFTDSPEGAYYQIRIDGGQVPLVFTKENCETFMTAVDKLLVQS